MSVGLPAAPVPRMPAGMAPPREGPPVGAVSPSTPAACSSGGSDHSFYTLGSSGATRHGDGGQASAGRGQSRRRGRGGLRAALLLAALLQALLGAACGAVRQTGQSEIGEPSSTILLAHEQVRRCAARSTLREGAGSWWCT